jgi:hypothetical protein
MWRAETLLRKEAMNIHCVVHDVSDKWFLVEEITDFHFDGFAIISKYSVERRRYNLFDKTLEQILRQEGEQPKVSPLSLAGSHRDVFTRLSQIDTLITLEADDESRFLIGSIHRIAANRIFMKHFPADGKWFARPTGIDYSEIGRVCFCDEYGRGWHRYHKGANKTRRATH